MRTCKRQEEEDKDRCGLVKHSESEFLMSCQISFGYQEMFTSLKVYLEWKSILTFITDKTSGSRFFCCQGRMAKDIVEENTTSNCKCEMAVLALQTEQIE